MKRNLLLLTTLFLAGVAVGVVYSRRTTPTRQLSGVRESLGTRSAGLVMERLADQYPDNAEVQFLQARQLRIEGKAVQAKNVLQRAADLGWPKEEVDREEALALSLYDFRKAEATLEELLDYHPHDRDVMIALGIGFTRQNLLAKADALANRLVRENPGYGPALCLRGEVRLLRSEREAARQDLTQAMQGGDEQPYYSTARKQLANCLLGLGDYQGARELFQAVIAEEPSKPVNYYHLGVCARRLQRWEEAEQAFRDVLRLKPEHLDTLLQMSYLCEERGQWDKALEWIEPIEKQAPDLNAYLQQMAKILNHLGRTEEAERYERRYREIEKKRDESLLQNKENP
jgi:tetratricopeptide (TPR) repeat protein